MKRFHWKNKILRKHSESLITNISKTARVSRKFFNFVEADLNSNYGDKIKKYYSRCIFSGYGRNVLRHFKLSKKAFKSVVGFGLFPGLRRTSW